MKHRQAIGPTCSPGHGLRSTADRHPVRSDQHFLRRGGPPSTQGPAGALEAKKRSDCPLLTLGLVLDGAGFVRSQVFAGRVESPAPWPGCWGRSTPRGALVVMDRGVATEDRIQWLREEGYRYVVASRQGGQFDPEAALTLETASKARLQLHKEVSDDGGEVRLYCRSEERAGTGHCRALQPALRAGARPTLRGTLTAAGSHPYREGPGHGCRA